METIFTEDIEDFYKIVNTIVKTPILSNPNGLIKKGLLELLLKSNFDLTEVRQALQKYNSEKIDILIEAVNEAKQDLLIEAICLHNSKQGSFMVDFDWNLKIILGTNELMSLKYPIVQLNIRILSEKSGKPENLIVELQKDQLKKLISVLETTF